MRAASVVTVGDAYIRYLLVPVFGLSIPAYSKIAGLKEEEDAALLPAAAMSLLAAYLVWGTLVRIHSFFQSKGILERRFMLRLASLCFLALCAGTAVAVLMLWIWNRFFSGNVGPGIVFNVCLLSGFEALFIVTLYETFYLKENKELERRLAQRLHHERTAVELRLLGNELSPHFVFNSLTILSQLVSEKSDKAGAYLQRLSGMYKYLLVNRNKDLVPLQQELDFARNYCSLVQAGHRQLLRLEESARAPVKGYMIVPLAMQLLVENVVKHNQSTESNPLVITISVEDDYVQVSNNKNPKPVVPESTHLGLRNLDARYRLLAGRPIEIEDGYKNRFTVKLPLIHQKKSV